MATIESTLEERGTRYGNYMKQTEISSKIKLAIRESPKYEYLDLDQEDALDMIAVKMSRILNGDPDYADNWHDIAGYATLVADRLDGNERE